MTEGANVPGCQESPKLRMRANQHLLLVAIALVSESLPLAFPATPIRGNSNSRFSPTISVTTSTPY